MGGLVAAVCRDETHAVSKPVRDAIRLVAGLGVQGDAHAGTTVEHRSRVRRDPTAPSRRGGGRPSRSKSNFRSGPTGLWSRCSRGGRPVPRRALGGRSRPAAARARLRRRRSLRACGPAVGLDGRGRAVQLPPRGRRGRNRPRGHWARSERAPPRRVGRRFAREARGGRNRARGRRRRGDHTRPSRSHRDAHDRRGAGFSGREVCGDGVRVGLWTSERELAAMSPLAAVAAREQLHPLEAAGVLDLVEPGVEVAPGIVVLPAPGHTPGQVAVEVDGALLYLADAILRELRARLPDRRGGLDTDPGQAAESLRALLDQAAGRGVRVAAAHLERFYSVVPDGDAYGLKRV